MFIPSVTARRCWERAIRDFARRDELVIATKVNGAVRPDVNGRGLSRNAILTEVDNSLRRLGTDYIDLYIIHRFDYETPLEETLETLNDIVRSGRVRYFGSLVNVRVAVHEGHRHPAGKWLGEPSCPCKIITTCSIVRKSGKCCAFASLRRWE